MKKRFFSLFVCTALLLSIVFSAHTARAEPSSDGGGMIYADPETGVTFVVPENWEEREMDPDSPNSFRARFHSLEDSRDLFLYGYLDIWNEMPAPERSGHTHSDVDSPYFYSRETLRELFVTLLAQSDFTVAADDVQFVRYGKNEYVEITFVREAGSRTVTFISSMHIENGYGYFFTFGAASDAAIEDYRSVLSSMQVPVEAKSDLSDSNIYTDSATGATFVVPDGWNVMDEFSYPFQVQFVSQKSPGSTFAYGNLDLWNEMTASERSGHTRSDINNDYIYTLDDGAVAEYWAKRFVQGSAESGSNATVDNIELVTYGKSKFIELSTSQEMFGINIPITVIFNIENGYMHIFLFGGNGNQAVKDFHSVLSSFQIPAAETSGSGGTGSGQMDETVALYKRILTNSCLFLLELGITFLIYALPFVVYCNTIRKRPVNKKVLAIIIIVLYEVVAWILLNGAMSWFLRRYANIFIPLFWGWFSYRKMVRRKDTDSVPEDAGGSSAPQQPVRTAPPSPTTAYIPTVPTPAVPTPPAPASLTPDDLSAPPAPASPAPAVYAPQRPHPRLLHRKLPLWPQAAEPLLPFPLFRNHPRPRRAFSFAETAASGFWRTASSAASAAHRSLPFQRRETDELPELWIFIARRQQILPILRHGFIGRHSAKQIASHLPKSRAASRCTGRRTACPCCPCRTRLHGFSVGASRCRIPGGRSITSGCTVPDCCSRNTAYRRSGAAYA